MTGRCIDGVVRQADVVVDCFAHAGDDIRTSDWIASRFRASTLAMTWRGKRAWQAGVLDCFAFSCLNARNDGRG